MKTWILTLAIATGFLSVSTPADARHYRTSGYSGAVYISGYRSCGTPVYQQRYIVRHQRCGTPVWGYRIVAPPRAYCPPPRQRCYVVPPPVCPPPRVYHHGSHGGRVVIQGNFRL
jgi:hypothetical protein